MSYKIINIKDDWYLLNEESIELTPLDKEKTYTVKRKTEKTISVKQNASLHMYLKKVADKLNEGGFTIQKVVALFRKAGIEWSMKSVKEVIWRNMQYALTDKVSTTSLNAKEVTKVYTAVDLYLSSTVGIESIDFPSLESLLLEQQLREVENGTKI